MDTQVLVVGAGPTGLLLAAELRRRGVECRLVDSLAGPNSWDRATVVHPRSLEIFESLGFADRFLAAGVPQRGARLHSGGEVLGELDFSLSRCRYEYNVGLSEEVTENLIGDYLAEQGGAVERATKLVGLETGADTVLATLERDGEREQLRAEWVVGCDGYHSATRELSGIAMVGHDIEDQWAVFDTGFGGREDDFETTLVYLEQPMVILTPLPGRRFRVYMRPLSADSDLVAEATDVLARYMPEQPLVETENPMRFFCHTKVAERWRAGRVLLAGDAAHVCSPSQGHGMNCGIQDAANLAWKLALVCQGRAASELLDSYEVERRPVAEAIGASGEDLEAVGQAADALARADRDRDLRAALADPGNRSHEAVVEAELNITYAGSPATLGGAGTALAAGERLPDVGPVRLPGEEPRRLHELAFRPGQTLFLLAREGDDEDLEGLLAGLREAVAADGVFDAAFALGPERIDLGALDELGVDGLALLAIRPDGHVGFRSDGVDPAELRRYAELFAAP